MVSNVHERRLPTGVHPVGELIDSLGTPHDRLWPSGWPPLRLDGPARPGARGGHGPIRYTVGSRVPGRRVVFVFTAPRGFLGTHEFRLHGDPAGPTTLVHRLDMRVCGAARWTWPLVWRPLHDALIEDCLDRAEAAVSMSAPATSWSLHVRALRAIARWVGRVGGRAS